MLKRTIGSTLDKMKYTDLSKNENYYGARGLFAVFYSLALILNGYASGIGSFSIGMICFIIFIVVALIKYGSDAKLNINELLPILFFIFMTVMTVVHIGRLTDNRLNLRNTIFYIIKFGMWAFSASITSRCLMDYFIIKKWLRYVANVSVAYIAAQYIFMYGFHVILPSLFTFGLLRPNYDIYKGSQFGVNGFRPSSFFAEPSFFALFMLLNLVLIMFDNRPFHSKRKPLVIYTLSIILSTSSGGIYIAIIVWCLYFIMCAKGNMRLLSYTMLAIVGVLGFIAFSKVDWDSVGSGVFGATMKYALLKFQTISTSGRIGKVYAYLDLLTPSDWIAGVGVGNEIAFITQNTSITGLYMNSVTQLIYWGGVLGVTLFACMNAVLFFRTKKTVVRVLIGVYLLYGFFSGMYFSLSGMIYVMMIELLSNSNLVEFCHDSMST